MSGPGGQPLTPVERAIIESIRRGEPDAEICARLGISIVDVKHKVEVLKQRFGVDERAALGGVDPDVAPASLEEEDESSTKRLAPPGTEDNFHDRFTQAAAADAPVHSRRAVLGALFAGGATVAGAGVYYLLGGGEQRSPASRDPFATPTPTPTPAPAPTPTPHPGLASLEPMRGAWTRRTYSSGETLELLHGIGFIDTETGEMEVFQAGMLRSIDTRPGYLVRPDGINGRAFTA
jgi:DNA-binding CsgD family transcriptional regulator